MQEYSSDEESDRPKRSSKVGWTFYNNVIGQVNHILRTSSGMEEGGAMEKESIKEQVDQQEPQKVVDSVKVATFEQLRKLGISLSESNEHQRDISPNLQREFLGFDSSFYPRLDLQPNVTSQSSTVLNETNTSLHMKALALKYLSDEQLGELALQKQGSVKHLMLSNLQGTNMSFATMRYLERYHLLPGTSPPVPNSPTQQAQPRPEIKPTNPKPTFQRFAFGQTPRTTCPSKILDISTLKQQPKLL